jgi:ParB-like chromosome segregation protein Spo0J
MRKQDDTTEAAAEWLPIESLTPWADNPRDNAHAVPEVAKSIKRFGFASPIIARPIEGGGLEIVAGHTRHKAAISLGLDRVPVRVMDLDPADAKLLALADNRLGELADWTGGLEDILRDLDDDGIDLDGLGWSSEELDALTAGGLDEEVYTAKVESPIYEIRGDRPDEAELFDQDRTAELQAKIEAADIDEPARSFLMAAAGRHTAFRYDKIAEYYAHACPEVQELMEDSALIIIDFDKAIELGFVKLTGELADAYKADHA